MKRLVDEENIALMYVYSRYNIFDPITKPRDLVKINPISMSLDLNIRDPTTLKTYPNIWKLTTLGLIGASQVADLEDFQH